MAVEVEPRTDEPQRPVVGPVFARGDEGAGGHRLHPRLRFGPRQGLQVDGHVDVDGGRVPHRPEVDVHVAEARRPHRQGGGEEHAVVGLGAEPPEPAGHVHIRRAQHPGGVELPEEPRRPQRQPGVAGIGEGRSQAGGRHAAT